MINKINNKKQIIYILCLIEILLFLPRIAFYVASYYLPNILGLPFVEFSFFISFFILILIVNITKIFPKIEFIFLLYIFLVFLISSINSPIKDCFYEVQGICMLIIDFSIFRISTYQNDMGIKLLKSIVIIVGTFIIIFCLSYILSPDLMDKTSSTILDYRMEGVITSSIAMGLFSAIFVFLEKKYSNIYIVVFGLISLLLLLFTTVTRTIIISCSIMLILLYVLKLIFHKIHIKNVINIFLIYSCIIGIAFLIMKNSFPTYTDLINYRFSEMYYDNYRKIERNRELELISNSPFIGYGVGLKNKLKMQPERGRTFFGHNFYTSQLLRYGFVGFCVFSLFIIYVISSYFNLKKLDINIFIISMTLVIGISISLYFANFIYYLSTGLYGAIFGIFSNFKKFNS